MKATPTTRCLYLAFIIFFMLNLANGANDDEDLMDFDFSDLKEIDWNYDMKDDNGTQATPSSGMMNDDNWEAQLNGHGHGAINFNAAGDADRNDDDDVDVAANAIHPFDWREKILRNALAKALANKTLRQKFIEVMPILRVLSKQQRLALSALISAQVNAKKGQELKLEQVRMMFGNDKKLLIPIVYDIARLVSNSARQYLELSYVTKPSATNAAVISRRKLDVDTQSAEADDVGTLPSAAMAMPADSSLEDFFAEMPADVLDPQSINEALQASAEKSKRARRDAHGSKEFVHKLIRAMPLSVNEADIQKGAAGRTIKLNTTSFVLPSENEQQTTTTTATEQPMMSNSSSLPSYQEIEDLAFASLNGTEIQLDNAEAATGADAIDSNSSSEPLPSPEELIAGPRYRTGINKLRIIRPKLPPPIVAKRKRVQVQQSRLYTRPKGVLPAGPPSSSPIGNAIVPAPRKCERFTASMCIRTDDYPLDQIMGSIRRHKNAMTALLAEYHDKPLNLDFSEEFDEFAYNKRRREDDVDGGSAGNGGGGSMCQSIVRYARPQKARSASGEWKYIVNTGQHTQTLRLEKCSKPQESCSYLAQNYRSHCAQVYNYHRLLSWDKTRGLHVDIFKVPTCCSCQIDGYRQQFPPLDTIKSKEFTPAYNPAETYSTINEELDYNDEEDDDDFGYQQYAQQHPSQQHHHHPHHQQPKRESNNRHLYENELQLGSQSVRSKVHVPSSSPGSYLTPPGGSNEYDNNYGYAKHRTAVTASASTKHTRRRPYKSLSLSHGFDGESRADLEIAPSETHTDKEVNIYGSTIANDKTRQHVQHKRKRIYSVPHTATSAGPTSSSSSAAAAVITTASINASSSAAAAPAAPFGRFDYGYGYGNGHYGYTGHDEHGPFISGIDGGGIATPSATTASGHAYQTSATSPSYYTPGAGQNVIRSGSGNNGQSKPRYRTGTNVINTQSPNAPARPAFPSAPTSSISTSTSTATATATSTTFTASLPTTSRGPHYATTPASSSSSSASSDAAYPSIYHISSIFNNSVPVGGSGGGGTKRINYNYHPIIDFFENGNSKNIKHNNKKRPSSSTAIVTTSTAATAVASNGAHTTFNTIDQIIPHKIPKYSSVINKKLPAAAISTAVDVNGLLQYRERRIGMGAGRRNDDTMAVAGVDVGDGGGGGVGIIGDVGDGSATAADAAGAAVDAGNGFGYGFGYKYGIGGSIAKSNHIQTSAGFEDNVWQPMLVT